MTYMTLQGLPKLKLLGVQDLAVQMFKLRMYLFSNQCLMLLRIRQFSPSMWVWTESWHLNAQP